MLAITKSAFFVLGTFINMLYTDIPLWGTHIELRWFWQTAQSDEFLSATLSDTYAVIIYIHLSV